MGRGDLEMTSSPREVSDLPTLLLTECLSKLMMGISDGGDLTEVDRALCYPGGNHTRLCCAAC